MNNFCLFLNYIVSRRFSDATFSLFSSKAIHSNYIATKALLLELRLRFNLKSDERWNSRKELTNFENILLASHLSERIYFIGNGNKTYWYPLLVSSTKIIKSPITTISVPTLELSFIFLFAHAAENIYSINMKLRLDRLLINHVRKFLSCR